MVCPHYNFKLQMLIAYDNKTNVEYILRKHQQMLKPKSWALSNYIVQHFGKGSGLCKFITVATLPESLTFLVQGLWERRTMKIFLFPVILLSSHPDHMTLTCTEVVLSSQAGALYTGLTLSLVFLKINKLHHGCKRVLQLQYLILC